MYSPCARLHGLRNTRSWIQHLDGQWRRIGPVDVANRYGPPLHFDLLFNWGGRERARVEFRHTGRRSTLSNTGCTNFHKWSFPRLNMALTSTAKSTGERQKPWIFAGLSRLRKQNVLEYRGSGVCTSLLFEALERVLYLSRNWTIACWIKKLSRDILVIVLCGNVFKQTCIMRYLHSEVWKICLKISEQEISRLFQK